MEHEEQKGQDLPPKEQTEDVNPVQDHELDSLEEQGERDVQEQAPDEAAADDTVDDSEDDTRTPAPPVESPDLNPPQAETPGGE